jgi:heat shock protein HslJ
VTPPVISPPVVIPSPSRRIYFLSGNYETNIKNDADLFVSFANDGKVSILNGCNNFNTEYFAFSNGSVLFNEFGGTFKYCRNDNDYLYLNALGDSV